MALEQLQSPYEDTILQELGKLTLSASHATSDHLLTVLAFAKQLSNRYGADLDTLTASVLLHDLGRSDHSLHGTTSSDASATQAEPILRDIGFPDEKIEQVLDNIADHDQPQVQPRHLEGKILKDADFLGGFGALGIARSALWTGESGGTMQDFVERISAKMEQRLRSLEFPESFAYAQERYLFVRLFLDKLQHDSPELPSRTVPYIVIEGISGSGKTTQAESLHRYLAAKGQASACIHEPSPRHARIQATLAGTTSDPAAEALGFLLDRYIAIQPDIRDSLHSGISIIADRSFVSTLVYQGRSGWLSPANLAYLHTLIIQPTHIIILDLPAAAAYKRILRRHKVTGTPLGEHEHPAALKRDRQRFLETVQLFPSACVIDTDGLDRTAIHVCIRKLVGL